MRNNQWLSILIAAALLLSASVPVLADSHDDPMEEPANGENVSWFLNQPIVRLLAGFFNFLLGGGEEGGDLDLESPNGIGLGMGGSSEPVENAEIIAELHREEKIGFGVITKLLGILEMTQKACEESGEFCDVTLESLVDEYQSGMSVGELFAKYGKPNFRGVGHVRKFLKNQNKEVNGD